MLFGATQLSGQAGKPEQWKAQEKVALFSIYSFCYLWTMGAWPDFLFRMDSCLYLGILCTVPHHLFIYNKPLTN